MRKLLILFCLCACFIVNGQAIASPEPYAVLSADSLTVTFYYDDQKAVRGGIDINNSYGDSPYRSAVTAVFDASFADYRPTSTAWWFWKCSSLTCITGIENLNTDDVTDMRRMFWGCSGLTSLDVSHFNTANVKDMSAMFDYCSGLTSLDVSHFNTNNVTDMGAMFDYCSGLTSLDVSNFNTEKVKYMNAMFSECSGLTSLDLSHFNTDNVTNMNYMFDCCSGLTILDLSHFNTANVTDMYVMFEGCSSLTTIYVGDGWSTAKVEESSEMFSGCTSLVGGAGTTYDASHTDATYAHIDGGTANPGYFTDINAPAPAQDGDFFTALNADGILMSFRVLSAADKTCEIYKGYEIAAIDTETSGAMNIPETVKDSLDRQYTVTRIGHYAFLHCKNITEVTTPSTVTSIGNNAFHDCASLTNYDIPAGVTELCDRTFYQTYFKHIVIPANITNIMHQSFGSSSAITVTSYIQQPFALGENAFGYSTQTATLYVPVGTIDAYKATDGWKDFYRIVENTNIQFADNIVKEICVTNWDKNGDGELSMSEAAAVTTLKGVFSHNQEITSFDEFQYFTNVTAIRSGEFNQCSNLKSIVFPASVTTIGSQSFQETGFTEFTIPNTVTTIEKHAFSGNIKLKSISIPASVTSIGTNAFMIYALRRIEVDPNNTVYDSRDNCNAIVETATNKLVQACKTSTIPNSIEIIGEYAFYWMEWTSITIPASVRSIEKCAFNSSFYTSEAPKEIICEVETPFEINSNVFWEDDYTIATLYVPQSSIDAYRNTPAWSQFQNIQPIGGYAEPEPYAVLSADGLTVTFYFDDQKAVRGGIDINNSEVGYDSGSPYGSAVTAVFDASFVDYRPTSTAYWFQKCSSLTSITGLEHLYTENVTYMSCMFYGCSGLTSLDVSHFNTANVTDMSCMFYGCSGLTSLDVSHFNTANVTDMNAMFAGCSRLTSLDVSNFNTSNMTSMSSMFSGCSGLTSLDMSTFNTANVTTMISMFYGCSGLTSLDLSTFNTANVTSMSDMFSICYGLTTIYVGDGWSTAKVVNGDGMFSGCTSLVGGEGTIYDASHTDATYAHIDGGTANPGYLTEKSTLAAGDLFTAQTIEGVTLMFRVDNPDAMTCSVAADSERPYMDTSTSGVVTIPSVVHGYSVVIIERGAFYGCSNVTEFVLPNTLRIINVEAFRNCSGLTSLHIPASLTTIHTNPHPWAGCSGLTTITVDPDNPVYDSRDNCNAIMKTAENLLMVGCKGTTIPEGTVTIGHSSFDSMGELPALVIPSSVKNIVVYAFWACSYPSVTSYIEEPFETSCVWDHVGKNCILYVPAGKVDAYKSLSEWNNFQTITTIGSANEAYAVLSADSTTLTFYYDLNKENRGGMSVGPFSSVENSGWNDNVSSITSVVFDASFADYRPTSTAYWFQKCSSLTSITGLENLNTANVTDMQRMFYGCSGLTNLNLSNFNTANVTSMNGMFSGCFGLTNLDVSNFNTANVTDMYSMFSRCSGLKNLDVSNFNTAKVKHMDDMFSVCSNLTSLDLSNFNTANVKFMGDMFEVCSGLTSLDLSNFNTANVTDMQNMFSYCSNLTSLDLSNFNTANVTFINGMFDGCSGLKNLDVSNFNTENMTGMSSMFSGCTGLTSLDLSNFNTEKVARMGGMFRDCSGLTTIYVGDGWNTEKVEDSSEMFSGCINLVGGAGTTYDENHIDYTYAHIDRGKNNPGYFTDKNVTLDSPTLALAYDGHAVTMTSDVEGATIFYTLDGSEPTTESLHYEGEPVALTDLCTVKAFASAWGRENSEVETLVVNSLFDGVTARIGVGGTIDEAFLWCGGIAQAEGLAAIVWSRNDDFPADVAANIQNPNMLLYVNDYTQALGIGIRNVVSNGLAQRITLTDNLQDDGTYGPADFYVPQAFRVQNDITYTHRYSQITKAGDCRGWETIALPFTVQTVMHETNGSCIPFASYKAGMKPFWLCELTEQGFADADSIRANIPYIISMPESDEYSPYYRLGGEVVFSARETVVPVTNPQVSVRGNSSFVPCFQKAAASSEVFALNVGEVRKGYAEGSLFDKDYRDVRPFEAYRTTTMANVRNMPIAGDLGGTTRLNDIVETNNMEDSYFNLQGLPVKTPRKGVYIKGGRKVVIR